MTNLKMYQSKAKKKQLVTNYKDLSTQHAALQKMKNDRQAMKPK